jgi:hypothetical protein
MTNRFYGRNRNNEPLDNDQLQKFAPSAFAGQPHESRSSRYAFIPTVEVIDGLRQAGFAPVSATQSLSRIPGKQYFTKHQLRFRSVSDFRPMTQVGDVNIEAVMTNSHDGSSVYEIALGAFRLACLNGMTVSEGMVQSIKVRHTGNIIEQAVESTHRLIQMAPKVVEAIREWKMIDLSDEEQVILAEGALALRYEDNAPITADKLLIANRNEDTRNDLWTVFNRVQENAVRGGIKYRTETDSQTRRMRTREVKGIDQNNRLNRELWALAEKMADLKR